MTTWGSGNPLDRGDCRGALARGDFDGACGALGGGREAADDDGEDRTGVDFTDFLGEGLGTGAATVTEMGAETEV